MTVSFSVFSFLSAPALSLTMPQDLFSAALGRLTASPGTAESATKWRSSENPLVRCFQLPLSQISGSCLGFPSRNERNRNWCLHLTQILDDSLICAASLIQSTLQCFDRTLFVEIVSKPSSNVTFSYSTNCMNERCFLPMHQIFEASKPSLSSVL